LFHSVRFFKQFVSQAKILITNFETISDLQLAVLKSLLTTFFKHESFVAIADHILFPC